MTIFIRALKADDKGMSLMKAAQGDDSDTFTVAPQELRRVPGSPFAYWVHSDIRSVFEDLPAFEDSDFSAMFGLSTKDDFRFLRLSWETKSTESNDWAPFVKGGAFSPFYYDPHLLLRWAEDGRELKAFADKRTYELFGKAGWSRWINNWHSYFRPGITWPRRTNGLSFRILPQGCIFGDKSPSVFHTSDDTTALLALCALINSEVFGNLVSVQLARTELAQSFEVGIVQTTPLPRIHADAQPLASLASQAWHLARRLDTPTETSHSFELPRILQVAGPSLLSRVGRWNATVTEIAAELDLIRAQINTLSLKLYGLSDDSLMPSNASDSEVHSGPSEDPEDDDERGVPAASTTTPQAASLELLSWMVGVAFGRFDIRLVTGARPLPPQPGPFDPLPSCSPGRLVDAGQPAKRAPAGYPICLADDGILVDDPGQTNDLVGSISSIFEVVFGDSADVWFKEVVEALAPAGNDLRSWLVKHYFGDHLKRYSKSKRKAPLYWQVALPSGRYGIWLYAPKLTTDSFFTILQDVINPKVVHEERTLASMRQEGAPTSTQTQRELEEQESFVSELRQLADEIKRVAPLWQPDLDDGIVLAMSPLWRLVPEHKAWQKELRSKWQDLQSGKNDWAHLAMHLWPERVVPKCAEDRSLAIAHGLENEFWFVDEVGKWKARKSPLRSVGELVAARTSLAVKDALKNLIEAPDPVSTSKRTRKSKAA